MRHTGRTDIPLTEAGREEARALRERLADRAFSRVLVSPLGRAQETCELAGCGDGAETREELVELEYGDYEGLTTAEIRQTVPGWTVWTHGSPGGETVATAGSRLDQLVDELAQTDSDVAVFAHGHVLRVLAARWLEQPAEFGARLPLGTGRLSILGWEREARALKGWNA